MKLAVDEARSLGVRVLSGNGAPLEFATTQTDLLIDAELRGLPSHGLLRLPRIIERIRNGVCNPATSGKQTWRSDAFLEVDGELGMGPVVALAALQKICPRARKLGLAIAAIRNSNHIGMAGWYAERAALEGYIAMVWTTSEALVHPWGGTKAMLGTNPMAIAVPAQPFPFMLDVATSIVAMGKIHDHANRHEPIPDHWALDKEGRPTTDPVAAKQGAIAPFGGPKGYALGLGFEILVASLTRSALGADVKGTLDSTHVCNKGDVIIVIDPAMSSGVADSLSHYLEDVRACPPQHGFDSVMVPGDRAMQSRERISAAGIVIADEVWQHLQALTGCSVDA